MDMGEDATDNGGVSQQPPDSGEKISSAFSREKPSDIAMLMGNLENIKLEDPVSGDDDDDYSELHKGIDFQLEDPMTEQRIPKEKEVLSEEHSKPSKSQSSKNDKKLPTPRGSPTAAKKSRDVAGSEGTAKSAAGSIRHAKQQPAKSTSYTDRKSQVFKQDRKTDVANSHSLGEQTNLKPLKKGLPNNQQEAEAWPSSVEDTKPRRVGTLPSYGFSFRCDERAEKRREFYSKLEEKIHAKEMEKTTLQVKSKEAQEAEIKLIRKTFAFKAKPMPTFYQEPQPPKVELKKIPPTRAKSPTFGRRKSSVSREPAEEDTTKCLHRRRLSLDGESSHIRSSKVAPPLNTLKPKRKSLPSPSENDASLSSVSGKKSSHSSKVKEDEKGTSYVLGGGKDDAVVSVDVEEAASVDQDPEFASTLDIIAETHDQADDALIPNGEDTTSPCVGTEKCSSSAVEKDEDKTASVGPTAKINEIHDDHLAEDDKEETATLVASAGTDGDEDSFSDETCEAASVNQRMKSVPTDEVKETYEDAAVLSDVTTTTLGRTKKEEMCSSFSESCETADDNADDDDDLKPNEEETTTPSPIAGRETPSLTETSKEMEPVPTDEVKETRGNAGEMH